MKLVTVLVALVCVSQVLASNPGMFSSATRRVMDLLSLQQKRSYLVVTQDMRDQYVPGNIRAVDLSLALRADGHAVTIVSKNGAFATEFAAQLERSGVEMYSVATDPHFFTDSLLKTRNFDAAFMYLWFWGSELSVPQTYIPAIRAASPSTKVIVVTDDAHSERQARLNTVNTLLSHPVALDSFASEAEMAVYEAADAIMTVAESDTELLNAQLKNLNIPVVTVHWGHKLSSLAIPAASEIAPFERRSGIVFVGYGKNPSNQVGLEWFFEKVYPLVKARLANERIFLVGDAPADGYASLAKSGAQITPISQRDDASMRTILSSARVMIAPIFSTGLTTKVLLGMSNGIPVVATRMAAAGYSWTGHEAEFSNGMMVASSAQQFADALVTVSTNAAEWARVSAGGLALARLQTSPAQFQADVRSLVSAVRLRSAAKPTGAAFVAPSALRSMELKNKKQNPFELMAGTGGSSSSAQPDPCSYENIVAGGTYLANSCNCDASNPLTCAVIDRVCKPEKYGPNCKSAQTALGQCANSPIVQGTPQLKAVADKFAESLAGCKDYNANDATSTAVSSFVLAAAGVAVAALL
jgi:glycosyltransferase involved in cell wall biosynthesis